MAWHVGGFGSVLNSEVATDLGDLETGRAARTMRMKTIAVMATLDTKGVEAQFVAEQIQQLGTRPS